MGNPGQALSYETGQLKILEWRAPYEKQLSPKFDLRAFHDELLAGGAMPLAVAERRMVNTCPLFSIATASHRKSINAANETSGPTGLLVLVNPMHTAQWLRAQLQPVLVAVNHPTRARRSDRDNRPVLVAHVAAARHRRPHRRRGPPILPHCPTPIPSHPR